MRNVFFFHLKSSFLVLEILKFIVVLAVLHLCLLSPQHKSCWCWLCRQLLYVTLFFISPLFLCLFNLEFQNLLLSVPSCYFPPLYLFHPTLFYSSFYSLFCFLPLFIRFIFWSPLLFSFQICYPFFSLSYYSVLSASPLCSIPIQSVLFLLVFIHLDPSI